MRNLLAVLVLWSLCACATPQGRHNVAVVAEITAGAALATGTGYVASGMVCYMRNEWNGPNLGPCDSDMYTALPFVVAANIVYMIAEPAKKRAKKQLEQQGNYIEMSRQEYDELLTDFCRKQPANIACTMNKEKK